MGSSSARHGLGETWGMFASNRAALFGLALWILIVLLAAVGPYLYPHDPFRLAGPPMTPPGREYPLGTDYLGRDILSGIVHGGRVTLVVGVAATLCTVAIGLVIGALSGFYGRWVDNCLMRFTEFFQVLPPLLLAMVLVTLFSPRIFNIILAIGLVNWTVVARLTRAEFLRIKESEFVTAARAAGAGDSRLIWNVILPNSLPPLIIASMMRIGVAILLEATLSFLGLSDPNVVSWGQMIGASRDYLWDSWWAVTFPGLAISLAVLSFCLIGEGLTDAINPRLRLRREG